MKTSQASEQIHEKYFHKEKTMLKVLGISLTGNEGILYRIYSLLFLFITNAFPFLQFTEVFKDHDFDVIIDILIYEFGVFVGFAKTMVILRKRLKLGQMLDKLKKEPFIYNQERGGELEFELIKRCVFITDSQTITYWIGLMVTQSSAAINVLIKRLKSNDYRDWEFPYGPLTLLNVSYSPNYELSWFYQQFSLASIGFRFATIDILTAAILVHISFQLRILQNNFKCILKNSQIKMMLDSKKEVLVQTENLSSQNKIEVSRIPWKYLQKSLRESVEYHKAILDITEEIEEVFSVLLLTVFLGTLGMLCFVVYKASLFELNDIRLIITLMEGLVAALQVLIVCYWSDQVTCESLEVGSAIYSCNFQGSDRRFQKSIGFIIRRTQNPIKLTAGKFTDISMTTFTWILRSSYSMFMVLRNTEK